MAQFMWGRSPPEFPDIRTMFLSLQREVIIKYRM